ncbi:unnamed protein product, partial [marine sediment metagenome]
MEEIYSYKGKTSRKVVVGYIDDNIYFTERRANHYFRIFKGFGLSIDVYNQLVRRNIQDIRIIYIDKGDCEILDSELSQWNFKSKFDNQLDTGEIDPQYILSKMEMKPIEMKGGYKTMKIATSTKEKSTDFEKVHIDEDIYEAELKEVKDISDGQYGPRVVFVYKIVSKNVELALICYKSIATKNNK